jgi:hypothetical protein
MCLQAKYVAIWKLSGANELAIETPRAVLSSILEPLATATLTKDPTPDFFHIDRTNALATLLLRGLFLPETEGSPEERLSNKISAISASRAQKTKAGVFLVIEGAKDVPAPDFNARRDSQDFSICFHAIDNKSIVSAFRPFVDATLFALSLSLRGDTDRQAEKLGEVVYLVESESDKPIYSFTMSMGTARASLSSALTTDMISSAGNRVTTLLLDESMSRPMSLLNTSFDENTSPLQAFMASWSALEIFVNATFKATYEARWFAALNTGVPLAGGPVLERFKEVMLDKYRLSDKFLSIAALLSPDTATADEKEFRGLKKVRDDLMHGLASPEQLPTHQVQLLLLKYARGHLERNG